MKTHSTLFIFALLLTGCQSTPSYDLLIKNTNLWNGLDSTIQENQYVFVQDGQIAHIETTAAFNAREVIEGVGLYTIPGLFDAHVHTTDYMADFPKFIQFGVTAVFITGGSLYTDEYFAAMRAMGKQDSFPAPRVFHTSQHFSMEGRHPAKMLEVTDELGSIEPGKQANMILLSAKPFRQY